MPTPRPTTADMFSVIDDSLGSLVEKLEGSALFEVRVLRRMIRSLAKEVAVGPGLADAERQDLAGFLKRDGSLDELNQALCDQIREGAVRHQDNALRALLRRHVEARLTIDNPKYISELNSTEPA